jgi:hypothetical protein
MPYEIKRFDLGSVFKITFLISLVIGLLFGLFFGMFMLKMITAFSAVFQDQIPVDVSHFAGAGMVFLVGFIAVALAVQWSVLAVIAAAVYNLLAGSVGGLKVELGEVVPRYLPYTAPVTPSQPPGTPPTIP